jgi:hypothetical protein
MILRKRTIPPVKQQRKLCGSEKKNLRSTRIPLSVLLLPSPDERTEGEGEVREDQSLKPGEMIVDAQLAMVILDRQP